MLQLTTLLTLLASYILLSTCVTTVRDSIISSGNLGRPGIYLSTNGLTGTNKYIAPLQTTPYIFTSSDILHLVVSQGTVTKVCSPAGTGNVYWDNRIVTLIGGPGLLYVDVGPASQNMERYLCNLDPNILVNLQFTKVINYMPQTIVYLASFAIYGPGVGQVSSPVGVYVIGSFTTAFLGDTDGVTSYRVVVPALTNAFYNGGGLDITDDGYNIYANTQGSCISFMMIPSGATSATLPSGATSATLPSGATSPVVASSDTMLLCTLFTNMYNQKLISNVTSIEQCYTVLTKYLLREKPSSVVLTVTADAIVLYSKNINVR